MSTEFSLERDYQKLKRPFEIKQFEFDIEEFINKKQAERWQKFGEFIQKERDRKSVVCNPVRQSKDGVNCPNGNIQTHQASSATPVVDPKPPVKLSAADDNVCQSEQDSVTGPDSDFQSHQASLVTPLSDIKPSAHACLQKFDSMSPMPEDNDESAGYDNVSQSDQSQSVEDPAELQSYQTAKFEDAAYAHGLSSEFSTFILGEAQPGPDFRPNIHEGIANANSFEAGRESMSTTYPVHQLPAHDDGSVGNGYVPIFRADYNHLNCGQFDFGYMSFCQSDSCFLSYDQCNPGHVPMDKVYQGYLFFGGQFDHRYVSMMQHGRDYGSFGQFDRGYLPFGQFEHGFLSSVGQAGYCMDRDFRLSDEEFLIFGQSVNVSPTFDGSDQGLSASGRLSHAILTFGRSDVTLPTFHGFSPDALTSVRISCDYPSFDRFGYDLHSFGWFGHICLPFEHAGHDLLHIGPADRGYTSFGYSEHDNPHVPCITRKPVEVTSIFNNGVNVSKPVCSDGRSPQHIDGKFASFVSTELGNPTVSYPLVQFAHSGLNSLIASTVHYGQHPACLSPLEGKSSLYADFETPHPVETYEPRSSETNAPFLADLHIWTHTVGNLLHLLTTEAILSKATATTIPMFRSETRTALKPPLDISGFVHRSNLCSNSRGHVGHPYYGYFPWPIDNYCIQPKGGYSDMTNSDMTELPVTSMDDEKSSLNLFCEENVQLHRSMSAFGVLHMCFVLPVSDASRLLDLLRELVLATPVCMTGRSWIRGRYTCGPRGRLSYRGLRPAGRCRSRKLT